MIVTLSSNGNGDLFYVPYRRPTSKDKGCSGVGIQEMSKWTQHFLSNIGQRGDILIMDNLSAHHYYDFVAEIEAHGIQVLFFPVRAASKLSPLDNCFFSVLKYWLSQELAQKLDGLTGDELRIAKRSVVFQIFTDLINEGIGLRYFYHCKYDIMGLNLPDCDEIQHLTNASCFSLAFPFEDPSCDPPETPSSEIDLPPTFAGKSSNLTKIFLAQMITTPQWRNILNENMNDLGINLLSMIDKSQSRKVISIPKSLDFGKPNLEALITFIQNSLGNSLIINTKTDLIYQNMGVKVPFLRIHLNTSIILPFMIKNVTRSHPEVLIVKVDHGASTQFLFKPEQIIQHSTNCAYALNGIFALNKENQYAYYYHYNQTIWLKFITKWTPVHEREPLEFIIQDIGYGTVEFLIYVLIETKTTRVTTDPYPPQFTPRFRIPSIKDRKTNVPKHPAPPLTSISQKSTVHAPDSFCEIEQINLPLQLQYQMYDYPRSSQVIGLNNLGQTCHFNCATQFLASFRELFLLNIFALPHGFTKYYLKLLLLLNQQPVDRPIALDPKNIIKLLPNANAMLEPRDVADTLCDIIVQLTNDINPQTLDLKRMFYYSFNDEVNHNTPYPLAIYIRYSGETLYECLDRILPMKSRSENPITLPSVLMLNINRNVNPNLYYRLQYPRKLNLENYNITGSTEYELFAIIAYLDNPAHYSIIINRKDLGWVWIDDRYGYYVTEDTLALLQGGNEIERLWGEKLRDHMWISKILIYKSV